MHISTPEAIEFVKSSLASGHTRESVWLAMLQQGWEVPAILQLFKDAGAQVKYPQTERKRTHVPFSRILLGIGAIIVVIAGVLLIGTNWQAWGSYARIFAIFVPMAAMFAIGIPGWYRASTHKNSIAFIFVGAVLFPMFVFTFCTQLELLHEDFEALFLAIMGSSLLVYIACYVAFPNAIWALLICATGAFTYYFALAVLNITSSLQTNLIPWLFLLLAGLYVAIGVQSEQKKKDKDTTTYFYFGGIGLLIVSLYVLALTRGLVEIVTGDLGNADQSALIGWSVIGVGLVFIAIAYALEHVQQKGLVILGRYAELFHFFGPLSILAAVFAMGLDGVQPFYETLLLALSIATIAMSVWLKRQGYLLVGSVGLIVYIFTMGSEYFSDAIGWPITLFVTGMLAMGVGYAMERLRKTYKQELVGKK